MLRMKGKYSASHPNGKTSYVTKLQKISCKTFHRKNYITAFPGFVYNILSNKEIFKKLPEMLVIEEQVVSRPPKRQFLLVVLQNCKKSAVKHFILNPT